MSNNPRLNQSIKQVLERLPIIINDIQARPDFNDNAAFIADISFLNGFKQTLLNVSVAPFLSTASMLELQSEAEIIVLPLIETQIIANVSITKMGALCTNRTITPTMASQHNQDLASLQDAVQSLVACLAGAIAPPPPQVNGRLVRLEVNGAKEVSNGQYVADYAPGSMAMIRAIVEPPVPGVCDSLIWEGGEVGYSNDCRLVPRNWISGPGHFLDIAAWLGNTRLKVELTVQPLLGGLEVSNAVKKGDHWIAQYSYYGEPVVVRAAMMPDIPEAYAYLKWEGGSVDPDYPNECRLVSRGIMTSPRKPVTVSAKLIPKYEVQIEVVPQFTALVVATWEGVITPTSTSGNTSYYAVDYGKGYVTITADTDPAGDEAWSHIVWTGNAANSGQANCKVLARDALTPFSQSGIAITATVGDTVYTAIIKVTPALVSLDMFTVNGRVFETVVSGNTAEYVLGYAPKQHITVTATTDPDDKYAWAYINWAGDGMKGPQANCKTLSRTALTPFGQAGRSVRATVGGTTRVARLKIIPTLNALTIKEYGFESGMPQQWYSYQLANPNVFGILGAEPKAVVQAETTPNTAVAWNYIAWVDNGNLNQIEPGSEARQRTIRLDSPNTVNIIAIIGEQKIQAQLDIRAPLQCPGSEPELAVNSITFSGGRAVTIDYMTGSSNPALRYCRPFPRVWHSSNPGTGQEYPQKALYQPPQAYTRNTPIGLAAEIGVNESPNVDVKNAVVRATAFFRQAGEGTNMLRWQQNVSIPAGSNAPVSFQTSYSGNLPDTILYEDPLLIFWELSHGQDQWILFDVTSHSIYVTLKDPIPTMQSTLNDPSADNTAYAFWTMLDISCATGKGMADAASAAYAIYLAFMSANPNKILKRKHDGTAFKYWNPREETAQHLTVPTNGIVPPQLVIANGSGSSLPFAEMLLSMFGIHGIFGARLIEVKPNPAVAADAVQFMMRNWTFNPMPYSNGTSYTHYMNNSGRTGGGCCSVAGWATWSPGAGQNNQNPPPAFQNHFIVQLEQIGITIFFDPSYGSAPVASWFSWVNTSIDGLARSSMYKLTGQWFHFLSESPPVRQLNAGFAKQNPNQLPVTTAHCATALKS